MQNQTNFSPIFFLSWCCIFLNRHIFWSHTGNIIWNSITSKLLKFIFIGRKRGLLLKSLNYFCSGLYFCMPCLKIALKIELYFCLSFCRSSTGYFCLWLNIGFWAFASLISFSPSLSFFWQMLPPTHTDSSSSPDNNFTKYKKVLKKIKTFYKI